jgi:magnesium-transporting ATPase (P-type)
MFAESIFVSTGSWLGHQLSVIDWISQVMPQERIDVETRKETGRCDQSYSCNTAPWTSCLLLTTIITVICKSKRQLSWVCRFFAPSVLCGVGVIYCSLLLHPAIGSIRMALSVLQLSSCRIYSTDCHLRSRTVVFLKPICFLFRATELSGSQDHRLKLKLK